MKPERKPGQLWLTKTYHNSIDCIFDTDAKEEDTTYLLLKRTENKKRRVKNKPSQAWLVLVEGEVETWYESAMRDDILISDADTYLHENH